jgi:transglutaminase-like putative cysteine protease
LKNIKHKLLLRASARSRQKKAQIPNRESVENIFDSPAASLTKATKIIGFVLRALLFYIGLFGIVTFLCAASGLSIQVHWQACYISSGFIALICLIVCAVVTISAFNCLTKLLVPLGSAAAIIGLCSILYGNPFSFLWDSLLRIYNFALYHIASLGYGSLGNFMISDDLDYSGAAYMTVDPKRFWGVFLLTAFFGILIGLCMLKKVRLIPLCALLSLIIVPVFTYNISNGNIGIGCIIAFCLGCAVLKVYDYRYAGTRNRKIEKKKRRQEQKNLRNRNAIRKKEEKKALRTQAEEILKASLETDMDKRRSRIAYNAVFIAWRQSQKEKKRKQKNQIRDSKKQRREEKKAIRKAHAAEKKELVILKKAGNLQAAAGIKQRQEQQKQAVKMKKAAAQAQKRQRRKEKNAHTFAVCAAGGFAGFGAAVLALLALWIPMATAKENFPIITPINNKIQIARSYVTAYLTGNDVDLNDLAAYGINELTPRSLSFDSLEYEDKRILRVETTGSSNVYLRSWIGSDFNMQTDTWTTADYDAVLAYRTLFGRDFTPDDITYNFYKYVYPSSVDITEKNVYKNLSKYGFNVQQVHVQRTSGSSLLLFIPAHMNPDIGLCVWGSLEEAEHKYSKYYDGVYSSRFYKSGTGYSTVSFITTLNRLEADVSKENAAEYYTRAKAFINENKSFAASDTLQEKIAAFDHQLFEDGIEYIGTNLVERYFYDMTPDQQEAFHTAAALEEQYQTYVQDTYTQKSGSPVVEEIAAQIRVAAESEGAATKNDLIMAVVAYLRDNYTYTKTPDGGAFTEKESSVLDSFLSEVKEGYCTHFATSAVMLLREYDIPVRFVEGYVASDFTRAAGTSGALYRSEVKDNNAHSWIEVYFEGMGWMQYEVTPGEYIDDMYESSGATIMPAPSEDESNEEDDEPDEPVDQPNDTEKVPNNNEIIIPDDEELSEIAYFFLVVGLTACVVLIGFIIYLIIHHLQKRTQLMLEKRYRVINLARKKEAYENASAADRHKAVRQINDWILDVFRIMGVSPEAGELPMDFAKRVSDEYAHLSTENFLEVMTYMQKEEFGHGLSAREADICGEYLSDLITSVYAGLSLWQKIRVRYIKRIL